MFYNEYINMLKKTPARPRSRKTKESHTMFLARMIQPHRDASFP